MHERPEKLVINSAVVLRGQVQDQWSDSWIFNLESLVALTRAVSMECGASVDCVRRLSEFNEGIQ